MKSSARTTTPAGTVAPTRSMLVVVQVALAVVLLSAAGLMLMSVAKLSRVSPVFDADRVLIFRLAMTGSNFASASPGTAPVSDVPRGLTWAAGVRGAGVTA